MGNQKNLLRTLTALMIKVGMGTWLGSNADVMQALAIPVFLVENAIECMEGAKELGKKKNGAAKNKLLPILSLIFLVVPFLDEAAATTAGAATMARVIALIGAGANAGLALQEVVENPGMGPFAAMELLNAGPLKALKDYSTGANFRGTLHKDNVATLGTRFVKQDEPIHKIIRRCKKLVIAWEKSGVCKSGIMKKGSREHYLILVGHQVTGATWIGSICFLLNSILASIKYVGSSLMKTVTAMWLTYLAFIS
jgi:chitinase